MCPALNCTSGQYQFAPCHGYRYYMCKASLDPGIQITKTFNRLINTQKHSLVEDETATPATRTNRYAISADRTQEQQQNPGEFHETNFKKWRVFRVLPKKHSTCSFTMTRFSAVHDAGSAVFKIGGGIIASLIAVLLLWMAAGIGLVVYLRRRINRDMERNAFDLMTANQQPLSTQSSNGTGFLFLFNLFSVNQVFCRKVRFGHVKRLTGNCNRQRGK
jgi:hypothetical protein